MANAKYKTIKLTQATYNELKSWSSQLNITMNRVIQLILKIQPHDSPLLILIKNKNRPVPLSTIKRRCSAVGYKGSPSERLNELLQQGIIRKIKKVYYIYPGRGQLTQTTLVYTGTWIRLLKLKMNNNFPTIDDAITYLLYKNKSILLNAKTFLDHTNQKVFIHDEDIFIEEK